MSSSKKIVKLKSGDGIIFKVTEAAAMQSRMLKGMLEEDDTVHEVGKDGVIPIPKVDGQTLKMVIEYWNKHVNKKDNENELKKWDAEFVDKDQALLYNLLMAANYLDVEKLLKLICWKVAEMIKGKQPEEIRQIFNIKYDFDSKERFGTMEDHMNPPKMSTAPPCIVPPLQNIDIRPQILSLLPTFHGVESENAYTHVKDFEDVCRTFHEEGVSSINDMMRLKFFPFTLRDRAKIWLNSLTPRSIHSWAELQAEFLKKFYLANQTIALKKRIINFTAKEDEKFYECWERYIVTINGCPDHGFETWHLVSYFYGGITPFMKQLVETMCGGDEEFMRKAPEEAMEFLNYVAEETRGWDEPNMKKMKKG